MLAVVYFAVTTFIYQNDAARILAVFPVPSISHQVIFRPLTQELVRRGHKVTVITTDPAFPKGKSPSNLTEIDFHDLAYPKWKILRKSATGNPNDLVKQLDIVLGVMTETFEEMLKTKEFQDIIYNNEFDLILVESSRKFLLGLSHPIKVPVIQVSSLGAFYDNFKVIGAQTHNFLYPQIFNRRLNNLTLLDKVEELNNFRAIEKLLKSHGKLQDAMLKRALGPDTPRIQELNKNVDMLILNNYPLWDSNRPVPFNVVFMGGIHRKPDEELPKGLKNFLDSSKNGVVYVSFGTNASPSMLAVEKIQIMLNVFSRLPFDVLFKWDEDNLLNGISKNVRISKFFPQSDLLRHPKIKAFVTQGGLQSTDEAITAEVPLVCIPMFGDQWYNAEKYVHLGIGIRLDIVSLTETELEESILKVVDDKRYKENIAKLNQVLHDQPQAPLDRAIWWIEHVLRHGGGSHLRSPAANISWAQYLELELFGTILLVLLAFGTILFVGVRSVLRMIKKKLKKIANGVEVMKKSDTVELTK